MMARRRTSVAMWLGLILGTACAASAQTSEQVNTTSTQTLTNKTYSSPIFSGTSSGTYTLGGTLTLTAPTISNPTLSGSITGSPTWPSPGALGSGTPSTLRGTTITATSGLVVGTPTITSGTGSPEGVVTAPIGSLYLRTNGSTGTTFYIKESGAGNTGWVPFSTSAVSWSTPGAIGSTTPNTGAFTTLSATGQISSTLSTGTAPLSVLSTTKVTNLNGDLLDGADWAAPSAIGSTTPAAMTGTTVQANTSFNGSTAVKILWGSGSPEGVATANVGSVYFRTDGASGTTLYTKESGTGNAGWAAMAPSTINWSVPGAIGATTPNTGVFTLASWTRHRGTKTTPTYGASVTIDLTLGDWFVVTATNGTAFTISNPSGATPAAGDEIEITVKNASGGAITMTTPFDTAYKLATYTKPANGYQRTVRFKYDGSVWYEMSCGPEVPN